MDLLIAPGTVLLSNADRPPAVGAAGDSAPGWATDGNPVIGQPPALWTAASCNAMLGELLAVQDATGQARDRNNWSQVLQSMRTMFELQLQLVTASENLSVPAGKRQAFVIVWAGGGGGGGSLGAPAAGSGAGGGECRIGLVTGLAAGSNLFIQVGGGGARGDGSPSNGTAGGASSFGGFITANGGQPGNSATNALQITAYGTGGSGGSGGQLSIPGHIGGLAVSFGASSVPAGGLGGGTFCTGDGSLSINSYGFDGHYPGGGGNGGAAGGAGGGGRCGPGADTVGMSVLRDAS